MLRQRKLSTKAKTESMNVRGGDNDVNETGDASENSSISANAVPQIRNDESVKKMSIEKSTCNQRSIREAIFPIYGNEVRKFLLMGAIKFFVIMALTLTRDTKDTLVVTQCGAEAIAFLKIYGVLPAATGFIAIYSKYSTLMTKKTLFYSTCIPFFLFFQVFDSIIYPIKSSIQPSLEYTMSFFGGEKGTAVDVIAKIFSNWTSALYFVVAELYSSVSVGILFWQFANDVVSIDEAKRFYPLFSQMGGLAPIIAGQYVAKYASQANDFKISMHRLTYAINFAGLMICLFYHLSSRLLEEEKTSGEKPGGVVDPITPKKKKSKLSLTESLVFLTQSQYLRLIGVLVIGYGLSINFTEIMWKSLLKKKYPDPLEYQRFIGNFSSIVGVSTCIVILFGIHVIRFLGWRVGAMATPGIMAMLAIPFFGCIAFGTDNPSMLTIAVSLGTIQSLLSKTAKYALFDPTTQMAYIPLDEDSKVKGKAAIDVLGSRIGKSGGSLIQQGLVLVFGNILNASPVVAVIYYFVLFAWLSAANTLNGLFMAKTEMQKAEKQSS